MKPVFAAYFDQGQVPNIDCVFLNTVDVSDNYGNQQLVNALQKYLDEHFTKVWGCAARVTYQRSIRPGNWGMVFVDDPDVAGALGYHDLTKDGLPIAKVFVKTTRDNGDEVSVTASHECLSGDTEIPLLNGTTAKIKDLEGKEPFWVYAAKENGELRPGLAHSVRVTKKDASLVRVTLDNGESIKCTPDHRFMLRDGTFKAAGLLVEGESLMPLYRKIEKMEKLKSRARVRKNSKQYPYEQVFIPATGEWVFTHRMVLPFCPNGHVRHHIDFSRFNNSPDNLEILEWGVHQKVHSDQIKVYGKLRKGVSPEISEAERLARSIRGREQMLKYNGSPEQVAALKRYWDTPGNREACGKRLKVYASSEENRKRIQDRWASENSGELREKVRENMIAYNKSEKHREVARKLGTAMFEKMYAGKEGAKKRLETSKKGVDAFREKYTPEEQAAIHYRSGIAATHSRWHVNRGMINPDCSLCQAAEFNNHKVVSIEHLLEKEDVYDLTVDKYHTVALSAGVFVHNCEFLVDPGIQMIAQNLHTGVMYAYETHDAVEAESFLVDGIPMSNFQYPSWFESFRKPGSVKFDHMGTCKKPFQINKGGYMSIVEGGNNWKQIFGSKAAEKHFDLKVHSRAKLRHEISPLALCPAKSLKRSKA